MHEQILLEGPADLGALEQFLASDRAPPDCMLLSELDGFLAGVAVSPEVILPSAWLPVVWGDDEQPAFADLQEAGSVLGLILRRYNEIIRLVDQSPGAYQPVLIEREDNTLDASDWAFGFIQAMALCQDAWEPMAKDPDAGALMVPIMLIASTTDKADLPLDDNEKLPEGEMAKLLADPGPLLGICATGLRAFFQKHAGQPQRRASRRRKRRSR